MSHFAKQLSALYLIFSSGQRSHRASKLLSQNENLLLYESKLSKGVRLLWEKTVAFSPRLSREGAIFSDIIRILKIVTNHDSLASEIVAIQRAGKWGGAVGGVRGGRRSY